MTARHVRTYRTVSAIAVLGAGWLVLASSAAADRPAQRPAEAQCAAPPTGSAGNGASDIDGDLVTDPVVGVPGRSPSGGIVEHGSRSTDPPRFLPGSAFAGLEVSTSFGTAIARHDVNNDGCDDLVVSDPDLPGGGAVDVLWGSPSGVLTTGAVQIREPAGAVDDGFGSAVAMGTYANNCPRCTADADMWVGAPDRTVDGKQAAGAVELFTVAPDGTAVHVKTFTEDDVNSADVPTQDNHFGAVLAAFQSGNEEGFTISEALAGVPNEAVDQQPRAGGVANLSVEYDPIEQQFGFGGEMITQDSPGVAGTPEAFDEFGAAVSAAGPLEAAIGVPDEDIGTIRDAGLVQTFGIHDDGETSSLVPDGAISQNSPGVPGVAEAGDHFGAAVAVGVIPNTVAACQDETWIPVREVVIGVPGEDNAGHTDSGTVVVQRMQPVPGRTQCTYPYRYQGFTQGSGGLLGGANEPGDEVGAAVDVTSGPANPGLVMIGVPGESIAGLAGAGTVQTYANGSGTVATVGNVAGRQAGLRFGAVLPVEG